MASPYRPAPGPASAQEHRCNGSARVHSQAGVDSLVSRLPARHPVRALLHPGSGRRRQAPGTQPHAREIRAVAQVATGAARRVADGHGTAFPRCHQRAEQDRRRSRPGVRTPPGGGLRAQSRGHRLRARPAACSAPSTGDSRTVVLCPAEGEGDPHGGSAPFGSCGTQASHRSVPAGRSEAALGEAGGRKKFSLLLTTRFGNAVAVNTWNTYTWKPALAKAGIIPPRAEGAKAWQWAAAPKAGSAARALLACDHSRLLCSLHAGGWKQGTRHHRRSAWGAREISLLVETPQILPSAIDPGSRSPRSREAFRGLQG